MNWFLVTLISPAIAWFIDMWVLRKENKELKKSIKALKDAKTKTEIDIAIDNLP